MPSFSRPDGRACDQLRPIAFIKDFAPHATGSVLSCFGSTRVICAATLEPKVPGWMKAQNVSGGWISAEYALLPYSTLTRKPREVTKGKQEGRTVEIQRLIGRALRAVVDLEKLTGYTLWLDCDVLQADGGTRTAAITGAYIAARLAVQRLIAEGKLAADPFRDSVAAVSVGIFQDREILDLNYLEDKDAAVDCNVVMTSSGQIVEIQGAGEESTFSESQLHAMLAIAKKGLSELSAKQAAVLA